MPRKSLHSSINNLSYKSLLIILFFLLISIVVLWKFVLPNHKVSASWWNDGWNYRKAISISNSSGSNQDNTQIKLLDNYDLSALVTAGKLQADLDDLRFTDSNGNLIKFWIEDSTNSSADIWAIIPSLPTSDTTIYMYYGNSSAINGETIFGTKDNPGLSCKAIKLSGGALDNIYYIDPTGGNVADAIQIYCDLNTDSGGWMLIGKSDNTIYTHAPGFFSDGNTPTKIDRGSINVFNLSLVDNTAEWMWQDTVNNQYVKFSLTKYSTIKASPDTYTKANDDTGQRFISSTITSASSLYQFTAVGNSQAPANAGSFSYATSTSSYGSWGQAYYAGGLQTNIRGFIISNYGGHEGAYGRYGLQRYNPSPYIATNSVMMVRESAFFVDPNFSSTFAAEEAGGGPIAYWKFDEGTGTTTYDSTPNKNNGTISNATWQTEDMCLSGKCLRFNNSNTFIDVGNSLNSSLVSQNFTIESWINPARLNGSDVTNYEIFSNESYQNYGINFRININGTPGILYFRTSQSGASQQTTAKQFTVANAWYHVAAVRNGTSVRIYINGKDQTESAGNHINPTLSSISGKIGGNGQYFNGKLDEVKIYPYARTADQIKKDYNSRGGGSQGTSANLGGAGSDNNLSEGLVGYWKMDEGVGTSITDSSGLGYTGTFGTGDSVPSWSTGKFGVGTSFDGTNDYINFGNPGLSSLTNVTISFWRKAANSNAWLLFQGQTGTYYVLATSGSGAFYHDNIGSATKTIYIDGKVATTPLTDTNWHHYVITGVNLSTWTNLRLSNYPNFQYNGLIDEIRIYNRALSPSEVTQLYNYAPGPVGYWGFDDGSGSTAKDKSGNNLNGSIAGNAVWKSGGYCKIGGCLTLDHVDDRVTVAHSPLLEPASITVEGWVKLNSTGDRHIIFTKWLGYSFEINSSGYPYFRLNGSSPGDLYSSKAITWGEWHHIAATLDNDTKIKTVYLDGVNVGSTITTGSITYDQSTLAFPYSSAYYGSGFIDEFKIYNYARSAKQIIEDMNANHPAVSAKSAIAYYKFDEGYGTSVIDWGLGKNNGTFTGSTLPTWSNNGKFNKAINFDNTTGSITMGDPTNEALDPGINDFTISYWIKTNTSSTWILPIYKGGSSTNTIGYDFELSAATHKLNFNLADSNSHYYTVTTSSSIDDNKWHHIVGVVDRSGTLGTPQKSHLFVDGKEEGTPVNISLLESLSNSYTFEISKASYTIKGLIDDVKIYKYALTAEEIKQDYNQGSSLQMGQTSQTIGGTTTSLEYCIPGDTSYCASPIAEYKLDEGSGTSANDVSGNNKNGTWQGTLGNQWSQGKIGQAGKFNGTNNYISGSSNLGISGDANFTMCAWIKWTGPSWPSDYPSFMGNNSTGSTNNGLSFTLYQGRPAIDFWVNRWRASNALSLNTWYYICGTKTSGTISTTSKIYVNGQLVSGAVEGTDTTPNITDSPPIIGRLDGTRWFNGLIDQAKYYNYARTPAQIAYDYNKGGPVGWWKFDECQGNIVYDWSGIGNTGTIIVGASGTQNSLGTCSVGTSAAWTNGATGKLNSSLNFDGTDDYISIPNLLTDYPVSVSMWIKPNITTDADIAFYLYLASGKYITGGFYTSYGFITNANNVHADASLFPIGQWKHVVVTMTSSSTGKIYVDGIDRTTSSAQRYVESGTISNIGGRNDTNLFQGQIDDVRVYNYALTDEQVKILYNGGAVSFN